MKIKKYMKHFFLALFILANQSAQAQCPGSISITSMNVTPASCPSNGSFSVVATTGTGVTYQITSGPSGYPTGTQSSNTFSDLLPGSYTVKVACVDNASIYTTGTVNVTSTYTQLAANAVASNVCTSNTPGGTITTTVTAGTSTPFTYAYWQGDPSASDNTLTYGTSATYLAPAFGTYNVRVKDACGIYVTQQVTIVRNYPADLCFKSGSGSTLNGDLSCSQLADSVYYHFALNNNAALSSLPATGIDVEVYKNTGTCAAPVLTYIKTQHFSGNDELQVVIPKTNVVLKLKTPCGDVCSTCYTYSPGVFHVAASITQSACGDAANPNGKVSIMADVNDYFVYPVTYTIRNSANVIVATQTINSGATAYSLPGNFPYGSYTVTATDACMNTESVVLNPPATTAALTAAVTTTINSCTSQNGRVSLSVTLNGFMVNLANATVKIIAPSPTNVGVAGVPSNGNRWDWTNVLPGTTYYIQVMNNCGFTDTLQISTPAGTGQNQQIVTQVTQLCGGTGNIAVNIERLGGNNVSFILKNSSNATVGTGSVSGTFANLPAGTYSVVATVSGGCTYSFSKTGIVILASGSGPSIIKKIGMVCEDAGGVAGTTGTAILDFIGAGPLKVEYKKTSESDSSYILYTSNSDGTETITGLEAGTSYTVRITDVCGINSVTQLSIGVLSPISTENTVNPCVGQAYALSVPDMIDATYTWTKSNTVISNERNIYFPSYTASDNGTYTCNIVVAGCVTRTVTVNLNSVICGLPLPVELLSFNGQKEGNSVLLSWVTVQEVNNKGFNVQRSSDGKTWETLSFVPTKAGANGNSNMQLSYTLRDEYPLTATNYYRLDQVDYDGKHVYSQVVLLKGDQQNDLNISPNPVKNILYIRHAGHPIKKLTLLNAQGQMIFFQEKETGTINMSIFPAGIYVLLVQYENGQTAKEKVIKF